MSQKQLSNIALYNDNIDYNNDLDNLINFLNTFRENRVLKYRLLLENISNREIDRINIQLDDVDKYFTKNGDNKMVARIEKNTMRYVKLLSEAIDKINVLPTQSIAEKLDVMDEIIARRRVRIDAEDNLNQSDNIPPELLRRYAVSFIPRSGNKHQGIRTIGAENIGGIVSIRAMVTRVTDVKPLVTVACYTCDTCGYEIYQPVESKSFTPLVSCEGVCKQKTANSVLHMQARGTKFEKFQEIRVQELPDQVPVGHIPLSMTIHVRGSLTRVCKPGDTIAVDGVFLPMPYTGFRAMKAGLTCDTFLHAMSIKRNKINYSDIRLSEEIESQIEDERSLGEESVYNRLSRSLAPEIFGLEDVKKSLLLLLVGGATQTLSDGMKIRGDINMLMMGDPGVAKSQLLKHIGTIAPRSVYTTGKGSSGVGLTAAVTRDQLTGEVVLEGGALVLADMGICCIDEFDKMEETDRTAIYEVMEQQTVSIAKAGITTTLNARTSIVAAANPAYGRYNKKKSPADNIDLPIALLSRFDLLFVMVDQAENEQDLALAHHVLYVHQHNHSRPLEFDAFSPVFIRSYVSKARTFNPFVPKNLMENIIQYYVDLRTLHNDEKQLYCTPRTLLSILRLSQAAARLRFANEVCQADVEEAIRLFHCAKASSEENSDNKVNTKKDLHAAIFRMINDLAGKKIGKKVGMSSIISRITAQGYSEYQLKQTLSQYSAIHLLEYNTKEVWITSGSN